MPTSSDRQRRYGPGRGHSAAFLLAGALGSAAVLAGACTESAGILGPAPLPAPHRLRAIPGGPTSVLLTWEPVPGAQRYRLERAVATRPARFAIVSDTVRIGRYRDTGLIRSLGYLYRVASLAGTRHGLFSDSVIVHLDLAVSSSAEPLQHVGIQQLVDTPQGVSLPGRYRFVSDP